MKNRKTYNAILVNGATQSAADTVSSGTILIAFATIFGANNLYLGLLAALPYVANLSNFFAGYLLEKGAQCKTISIISSLISRPIYLLIAILPFITEGKNLLFWLFILIFLLYIFGNISGGTFGVWSQKIIPQKIIGIFFAKRQTLMMITKLILYWSIYVLLKNLSILSEKAHIYTYSTMFVIAFIFGIITTATFFFIEDRAVEYQNSGFWLNLKAGFSDKHFLNLMLYTGLLSFTTYFFFPFVSVYMLKSLNYSMETVIIMTIFFQIAYILSLKFWGEINDKINIKRPIILSLRILIVAIVGFLCLFGMQIANAKILFTSILLLHLLLGISNSSIVLSLNNIPLVCIPQQNSKTLIPITNAVKSTLAGLGSALAGIYITYGAHIEQKFNIANKDGFFLFFAIALIMVVYLILNTDKIEKYKVKSNENN